MSAYRDDQRALVERLQRENATMKRSLERQKAGELKVIDGGRS
ncbi:MAG: hypothetical protein RLP09_09685 [Sandaracinaceae bacterium]